MEEPNINPQQISLEKTNAYYLPALTGIRFFAIFHIFMFHLVSLYGSEKPEGMENMLAGFDDAPQPLVVFASNGWISTSLFFLLSGFILAHLCDDGTGPGPWSRPDGKSLFAARDGLFRRDRLFHLHLAEHLPG